MTALFYNLLFAAAILVAAASCQLIDIKDPDPPRDEHLIGPVWQLRAIEMADGQLDTDLDDRVYKIQFQSRGWRAGIRSDCNSCSGSFELGDRGALEIEVTVCTEAACPPGTRTDEYVQRLREVTRYEIDGRTLRIFFGRDAGALVHAARER